MVQAIQDEYAAIQQERAARRFIRHLTNQLPTAGFSRQQRKGFMLNGISRLALVSGLADWSNIRAK